MTTGQGDKAWLCIHFSSVGIVPGRNAQILGLTQPPATSRIKLPCETQSTNPKAKHLTGAYRMAQEPSYWAQRLSQPKDN